MHSEWTGDVYLFNNPFAAHVSLPALAFLPYSVRFVLCVIVFD
jgi:hypothetical protein